MNFIIALNSVNLVVVISTICANPLKLALFPVFIAANLSVNILFLANVVLTGAGICLLGVDIAISLGSLVTALPSFRGMFYLNQNISPKFRNIFADYY